MKSWLIWEDPDARNDWGQEEKGMTEDEMVEQHHWLNGHGFGWTLGIADGQGGLVCCSSWVTKSRTWLSKSTDLIIFTIIILNSLSSSLPISSSFIWISVFLVRSFICAVFLPFIIFLNTVFEVSFSQGSRLNSFFLLVSALLTLFQWFLWASYMVILVLRFFFFF